MNACLLGRDIWFVFKTYSLPVSQSITQIRLFCSAQIKQQSHFFNRPIIIIFTKQTEGERDRRFRAISNTRSLVFRLIVCYLRNAIETGAEALVSTTNRR